MSTEIKYVAYPATSKNVGIRLNVWNRPEAHQSALDVPTRYLMMRNQFTSEKGVVSYSFGDQDCFMSCSREYLEKIELVKSNDRLYIKIVILPRITTELDSVAVKVDDLDELLESVPMRTA